MHTVPNVRALIRELKGVEKEWFNLGLILKVNKERLDLIRNDSNTGAASQMEQMFEFWLVEYPEATWQDVIGALESLGNQEELTTRLRGYYINTPGLFNFSLSYNIQSCVKCSCQGWI